MAVQRRAIAVPENAPYLPSHVFQEVAYAIRGVNAGTADASQQALAVRWIVHEVTKAYDMSYRPESARDSDFAEGKRYVGNELIRVINMTNEAVARLPKMRASGAGEDDEIQNT